MRLRFKRLKLGLASTYASAFFLFLTIVLIYFFINSLADLAKVVIEAEKNSKQPYVNPSILLRIVNASYASDSNNIYIDLENYGSHTIILGKYDEVIVKYKYGGVPKIEIIRDFTVYAIVYPDGTLEYVSSKPISLPPKSTARIVVSLSNTPDSGKVTMVYVHWEGPSCDYVLTI